MKILSTTSNIYWKYFCTNKLQDISIAKYCQAQPSPSLPGLSSYIGKTRVSSKVRLFDRFQFKDSEFDRFEKLDSCAALVCMVSGRCLKEVWRVSGRLFEAFWINLKLFQSIDYSNFGFYYNQNENFY